MFECNKVVKKAHENADRKVIFRRGFVDWSTVEVFLATDSGHAYVSDVVKHYDDEGSDDADQGSFSLSQKGRAVGISTPMTKDGREVGLSHRSGCGDLFASERR